MYKKGELKKTTKRQVLSAIFCEYGKSGPEDSPAFEVFSNDHGWYSYQADATVPLTLLQRQDQALDSRKNAYKNGDFTHNIDSPDSVYMHALRDGATLADALAQSQGLYEEIKATYPIPTE